MSTPVLHLLVGPNGSGKSSFVADVLAPEWPDLPFVNTDVIAAERDRLMRRRTSFVSETVFSHPSKTALVAEAVGLGYQLRLHVMLVPVDLSVQRVAERVRRGGHAVPEAKIRARHARLWDLVASAVPVATYVNVYDNTRASAPFRLVASFVRGRAVVTDWPSWTPAPLLAL